MASPTQWTWVWVNSRSWWWTGRPGVLWFMGSQRVGHDWATELTDWLMVKNLPAVQETRVPSLGREDPLDKGMATHSSILVWRIPQTEEPGGLQSMRLQKVGMTEQLTVFTFHHKADPPTRLWIPWGQCLCLSHLCIDHSELEGRAVSLSTVLKLHRLGITCDASSPAHSHYPL